METVLLNRGKEIERVKSLIYKKPYYDKCNEGKCNDEDYECKDNLCRKPCNNNSICRPGYSERCIDGYCTQTDELGVFLNLFVHPYLRLTDEEKRWIALVRKGLSEDGRILNLGYMGIENIPENAFPKGLKELYLSFNNIETIPENAFPEGLEILNLSRNQITTISKDAFPKGLQRLDLKGNKIKTIPKNAFPQGELRSSVLIPNTGILLLGPLFIAQRG